MWRINEVAERMGLSIGFLKLEITRGNLNPTRFGRRLLIHNSEVERYEIEGSRNQNERTDDDHKLQASG